MDHGLVKAVHLGAVGLTLALFVLRGIWMMRDSPRLRARWVRIVPHLNDTVLLGSGITLAILLRQYPLVHGWLTAKFFALITYIVLGSIALKSGKSRGRRIAAWLAALLVFAYLLTVARARSPFPFPPGSGA